MPFNIVRNDITKMKVDSIVNAANSHLQMGGGVCGAIFRAAGEVELQRECNSSGYCPEGEAVITNGYKLYAKYIIHAVGPIWSGGGHNEERLLYSCYEKSLRLAKEKKLGSIAFPLISAGIYGYPKAQAMRVASRAIVDFLTDNEMDVYLVLFDRDAVYIGDKIFSSITKYIDDNYIPKAYESRVAEKQRVDARRRLLKSEKNSNLNKFSSDVNDEFMDKASLCEAPLINKPLESLVMNLDESFSLTLMRLIDARGKTDVEVYKKANIDRKLFSKIRSNEDYRPSKNTVLAFAIALELSLKETNQLLEKAGFALSHCSRFDIIIEYFINKGSYDIYEINQTLFQFDQPTLGA
jgi:O-acetyl-ADP-ribose deacetylase (regulator of RNase III)